MSPSSAPTRSGKEIKVDEAISSIQDEPKQIDAIREIRGWFGPNEDNSFYPFIQEYLEGKSLPETIKKLSQVVSEKTPKESKVNYMDLHYSILHSAKRIPWKETAGHTKLVDLVKRLKSPVANEDDSFQGIKDWHMASREVQNDSPGTSSGFSIPEAHAWANLNFFWALLDKEDLWGDFCPLFGLWELREALERAEKDDGPDDAAVPATLVEKHNAHVPAAAVWVIALGKTLYDYEKDMKPTEPNRGNPAKGGELWKGKAEFSKERWSFWKKRFGEVSQKDELSKETRDIAKEAVEAMNEAERT